MKTHHRLRDLFSFPGFVARATLQEVCGDPKARVVVLHRQKGGVLALRTSLPQPL